MKKANKTTYSRLLKGKAAEKLFAEEELTRVAPHIPAIGDILLELRRVVLTNPFVEPRYVLFRHHFSPSERYLLDNFFIATTLERAYDGQPIGIPNRLYYKYNVLRYWKHYHRPEGEWTRISAYEKKPIYALTSEVKAKNHETGRATPRFWLPRKPKIDAEKT